MSHGISQSFFPNQNTTKQCVVKQSTSRQPKMSKDQVTLSAPGSGNKSEKAITLKRFARLKNFEKFFQ